MTAIPEIASRQPDFGFLEVTPVRISPTSFAATKSSSLLQGFAVVKVSSSCRRKIRVLLSNAGTNLVRVI
jgi:hypothetical protein